MKNPILGLVKQLLLLLSRKLPDDLQPFIAWLADTIAGLDIDVGSPKMQLVAELVEQLLVDIEALDGLGADARMKARLVLEARFGRAWIDAGLGGGGA